MQAAIAHLASIERPSASAGERRAADWIASRLRAHGALARVEEESAHGTYWWPLGLCAALGAAAGALAAGGQRRLGGALAAVAAAAIWDDVGAGRLWFRRHLLTRRSTWNVVAEAGDPEAQRTVVVVAHHDAAHSGLIFHPGLPRFAGDHFPGLLERADTTPPVMFPVVGGPLLVLAGALSRRRELVAAGTIVSLGSAAAMADIGARSAVPGANDNASGVAALLAVARALAEHPAPGVRLLFVSTGSEESFMEGMQAFARRHFGGLDRECTHVVCIDTVGSSELIQLEGEGMLVMRDYPTAFKDLVSECAGAVGVHVRRGLRFRNATDGLIALRAGFPTVMLGSIGRLRFPANYHWPTDTAENVVLDSVVGAARVCEAVIRRLAAGEPAAATV